MNRRDFIEKAVKSIVFLGGGTLLQGISKKRYASVAAGNIRLRFAIASDGHYGQPGTEYDRFHDEMMNWLTKEHEHHPLACCVFNGDLIHDDTNLFAAVKKNTTRCPYPTMSRVEIMIGVI